MHPAGGVGTIDRPLEHAELSLPTAPTPSPLARLLFDELRRRGVLRVAGVYLVGAWITIQVADTTFPALGLPGGWVTGVVVLALVGFPVAVGAAWFFDVRRDVRDVDPAGTPVLSPAQARITVLAAIGLGTAVLVSAAWLTMRPPVVVAADTPPPNHIAVLYFEDRTGDPSLAWIAPTATETLITELAAVSGLRITSGNGVRPYHDAAVATDSIGRALHVGTLITGSVTSSGDSVRVSVQLVDAATGIVESSTMEQRDRTQALALVDELVQEIAQELRPVIGMRVDVRRLQAGTASPEAWALVQRARQLQAEARDFEAVGGVANADRTLLEADSLLALAEREDARYGDAILERAAVARGRLFVNLAMRGAPPTQFLDAGIAHATRALRVDAGNARALELRGALLDLKLIFGPPLDSLQRAALEAEAERDLRAAVRIDTTRARAYSTLSSILESQARFAEARVMAQRAYDTDAWMESSGEVLNRLFMTSFELRDDEAASHWCATIRARQRMRFEGAMCELMLRAWSPLLPGDVDAAWRAVATAAAHMPPPRAAMQQPYLEVLAAAVIARARDTDSARAVLARAEAAGGGDPQVAHLAAAAYLLLGDEMAANERLARYAASEGYVPPQIAASRRLAGLRRPD